VIAPLFTSLVGDIKCDWLATRLVVTMAMTVTLH